MIEHNLVCFRLDGFSVFVHTGHLLSFHCAVDGSRRKPQHGHAHAKGFDLVEHQEGHDQRHQRIGYGHGAVDPEQNGCQHHPNARNL